MDETRGASARIRIGPAGWPYKDWAGQVSPQPQPRGFDPLRCLARYFEAIEINSTFPPASQGRRPGGIGAHTRHLLARGARPVSA